MSLYLQQCNRKVLQKRCFNKTTEIFLQASSTTWLKVCVTSSWQCVISQSADCDGLSQATNCSSASTPCLFTRFGTVWPFLFPRLKCILAGKRYASRKALGSAVGQCLRHIPASDYEKCFYSWIKRLKLYVKAKGEYFEGMHWTCVGNSF